MMQSKPSSIDSKIERVLYITLIAALGLVALYLIAAPASAVTWTSASGCWTATDGEYTIVKWNATGTTTYTYPAGVTQVEYWVVAGGAGGGFSGGGGGSGGFKNGSAYAVSGTDTIVVGAGGIKSSTYHYSGATMGGNSSFDGIVADGGGRPGDYNSGPGLSGGSGGGAGARAGTGDGGIFGMPSMGAAWGSHGGSATSSGAGLGGAGGGGGIGTYGANASGTTGGNGGDGLVSIITGEPIQYGGGGGGHGGAVQGAGGAGGGGAAGAATGGSGTNGLGGGGGGAGTTPGNGGSGVVIIRYTILDSTPPNSITGLTNSTALCDEITWQWTNPTSTDYAYLYTLKNNAWIGNYSNSSSAATWTGLSALTNYTFSSKTVDLKGNMNATWVNRTVLTPACDSTPDQITNPNIPLCHTQNFFFWNGSSSDIAGYRVLNNYPELDSTRTASVSVSSATGAKTLGSWVAPAVTRDTVLAPGPWRFRSHLYVSSATGTTKYEYIVYNRSSTGVETDLWYGNAITTEIDDLTATENLLTYARRNSTTLFTGDRLVIKINVSTTSVTARTAYITLAGNTQASAVQNGWWVCNESTSVSTPTPTPTAAPVWKPEINPPTDIKTDYVALFKQWWWLPALIFMMIILFGGKR